MFSATPFPLTLLDVPRAHIDPIHSLLEALSVVALSLERPRHHSLTALVCNSHMCGVGLVRTHAPFRHALHRIISDASQIADARAVVLVTTRPGATVAFEDGDDYVSASQLFAHAGITLVEWVVIGRGGMYCPRVLTDEPSRWKVD